MMRKEGLMASLEIFELDIIDVAAEIAAEIPGVTSVRLFGSRKYLGKVRSDLDLLISGPSNLSSLLAFRSTSQHYQPLDLWLATGETAISAVNGSALQVQALRSYELFPESPDLPSELRRQLFRTDIEYKLTVIPPASYAPVRGDHLGFNARLPTRSVLSLFKQRKRL
jgi:predicted nucleotidyltransferase